MTNFLGKQDRTAEHVSTTGAVQRSPGKSTLVDAAYGEAARATPSGTDPVQRKGGGGDAEGVHAAADAGIAGPGGPLPFGDRIQSLFGGHDVSGVRAHTGSAAAAANTSIGSTAYAKGNDIAFAGTPDLHTTAHEAAHVVQQRGGVQLKGGVGQAGDPYEQNADQVADRVVAGQSAADLLPPVGSGGGTAAVQRNVPPPSPGGAAPDAHAPAAASDPAAAKVKAASVELTSTTGKILLLILRDVMGIPGTQAEKDAGSMAVDSLSSSDFATLMAALQKNGLMDAFMAMIGPKNAEQTAQGMDVQFEVPAVAFTGVTSAAVKAHYDLGNKILKPNHMKVTQPSFTAVGNTAKEQKAGKDEKSLLGNTAGTFKEADLDADGAALDKVIDSFLNPGMITSFWFSDLVEDVATYGGGRQLQGQAVREKSAAKHKGKEAVFMDVNAAGHVFVHELGHIIGGKGAAAEHVTGADGTTATGDQNNVMFQFVMPGKDQTKLTPAQLQAFKTGIYARIQRVPLIGDFPTPKPSTTGLA